MPPACHVTNTNTAHLQDDVAGGKNRARPKPTQGQDREAAFSLLSSSAVDIDTEELLSIVQPDQPDL